MNMQETALLLKDLQAIYREIHTDGDSLQQWNRLLINWAYLDIQKAAEEYSRNYSKTPRPADLIRLAREAREEKRESRIKALGYWFDYPGFIWRRPQKEIWVGDLEERGA